MQHPHIQGLVASYGDSIPAIWLSPSDQTSFETLHDQMGHGYRVSGLKDQHILLVEDQVMISLDIYFALSENGAKVTDTVTLDAAIEAARTCNPTAAILDVDLDGELVFPAADILFEAGVPILFHTAHHAAADLQARYPGCAVCNKPTMIEDLLDTLAKIAPDQRKN